MHYEIEKYSSPNFYSQLFKPKKSQVYIHFRYIGISYEMGRMQIAIHRISFHLQLKIAKLNKKWQPGTSGSNHSNGLDHQTWNGILGISDWWNCWVRLCQNLFQVERKRALRNHKSILMKIGPAAAENPGNLRDDGHGRRKKIKNVEIKETLPLKPFDNPNTKRLEIICSF